MKKIISWTSALAIASSSLVAVPLSANAAVTGTLFSNSFNGYTNSVTYDKYADTVGDVMVYGGASAAINIDGMNLVTAARDDDTSYWKASTDEEGNTYLTTTVSRYSRQGRGASLKFDNTYTATSDIVVVSFKFMVTAAATQGVAPAFKIGNTVIDAAKFATTAGVESAYNTWFNAKLLVMPGDGTMLFDGNNKELDSTSSDTSVSSFNFSALDTSYGNIQDVIKEDGGYDDYMTISIDDLVIFTSDSTRPEKDEVPAAQNPTGSVVTPTPATTNAPKSEITVPKGATTIATADFDGQDLSTRVRVYPAPAAMSFVDGGFTVSAGTTSDTHSGTYGEVKTYAYGENSELSSKVLEILDGGHASAARGPKVEMTENVSTANIAGEDTYHMMFQVKLDKKGTDDAKIYLVDTKGDNVENESVYSYLGSDNQYKYVLATISTGDKTDDDKANRIARVPEGEWAVIDFELLSDGTYCVYVDGEYAFEHTGVVAYDGSSTYKITPSQLPAIVINTTKGTTNSTLATIDDLVVYTTADLSLPTASPTALPTPAPPTAKPEKLPTVAHPTDVIASADFEDVDLSSGRQRVFPAPEAMIMTSGDVTIAAGTTSSMRSETAGEVVSYTDSASKKAQVLKLDEGNYASAARGPIVKFTNDVTVDNLAEDAALHETFSVKLDSGSLYLVDTKGDNIDDEAVYSYLGKDYQYKYILATISTGAATEDDEANLVARVPAGEWAVIDVEMFNDGTYCVYVDGEYAFENTNGVAYDGSSKYKITPSQLPAIVTNVSKEGSNGAVARINEIYAYTVSGDVYTKYVASYDETTGVLTNLEITPFATPEAVTNTATQKTFFWTKGMTPYAE